MEVLEMAFPRQYSGVPVICDVAGEHPVAEVTSERL